MDIQSLKLELLQQVASTNDATVLAEVKRHMEVLRAGGTGFGQEPESSVPLMKEPEPIPVLRAEVKRLIDEVRDTHVLSSVLAFLRGDQEGIRWRSVLSARAARSEADFAAGRVYTQDQVEAHFKARGTQ